MNAKWFLWLAGMLTVGTRARAELVDVGGQGAQTAAGGGWFMVVAWCAVAVGVIVLVFLLSKLFKS